MGGSAPPAPDYRGAAQEQSAASREIATAKTWADRPDVVTPWGTQTWATSQVIDPSTGQPVTRWEQKVGLAPEAQRALESQMAIQQGRSQAAQQLLGQATQAFQRPVEYGQLPRGAERITAPQISGPSVAQIDPRVANLQAARSFVPMGFGGTRTATQSDIQAAPLQMQLGRTPTDFRQQAQEAVWGLQRPQFQERREATEAQLANMGISRGSEAWNREMRQLGDEESRARLAAISEGRAEAGQAFQQELAAGEYGRAAQAQAFGQGLSEAELANRLQQQEFGQALQRGEFGRTSLGQTFQQQMAGAAFENQARQQEFENLTRLAQLGDQQAQRQLDMQIRAGTFNQQLREQALQEEVQRRGMSLNELNALLTGQQVQMPQAPSSRAAAAGESPDMLKASELGYGSALDQYNAKQSRNQQYAQMAATAAMMFFSDIRLKEEIEELGILSSGVRVVEYRYRGLPGRHVGVIAQEVAEIHPDAVFQHPSGYLVVDYSKVI